MAPMAPAPVQSGGNTAVKIILIVVLVIVGLGVLGFFSYVSGLGWGWVSILGTPGVVRSWASPTAPPPT